MSLFRKPKKIIQRRVFSSYEEEDAENNACNNEKMDVDGNSSPNYAPIRKEKKKKEKKQKVENSKSKKSLLSFDDDADYDMHPNVSSAQKPVLYPECNVPKPKPLNEEENMSCSDNSFGSSSSGYCGVQKKHFISQPELNDMIRDLKLSKVDSEVLASRLHQWNCLDKSTKVSIYRDRSDPFSVFFTKTENICYCNNIDGLFEALKLQHIPNDWRLFIDSSKTSLKFALLHNGNKLPTIPIAHAVNTKETYEHIAHIFQLIQYNKYKWKVCADFKVIAIITGLQGGFTKYCCFICLWDSRARQHHFHREEWPLRKNFAPGALNVSNPPLVLQDNVTLPPLHIKLGLMKNFVKTLDKDDPAFQYLIKFFPNLSFAKVKEEEEGEVFQVKKSSQSKKVMRMLDKERRKKKAKDGKTIGDEPANGSESSAQSQNKNNCDSIQTEIRTDDFVLVVKKSEPENIILNGRAALCAGRDDMSSEEEEDDSNSNEFSSKSGHRFAKPDNFKMVLESGAIPDAAMIHAARKRRQKAREQGDFIPIEEQNKEPVKKGKRLVGEDGDDDGSEEERVDMNAITGIKEREERREKFYSVEHEYSGGESEQEMNEWENQQIRKGVTGAQLVTAQQESVLSQFMIKSISNYEEMGPQSTGTLLEQAYARISLEKPRQVMAQKSDNKPKGPKSPQEITEMLNNRLIQLKEHNEKHNSDIDRITKELKTIKLQSLDFVQKAPVAAAKYRFYQELRGYVTDLVECLDEKTPQIADMEKRIMNILSKHANHLIERRRQDVRDQSKEISDSSKPGQYKKGPDDEERIRRAAEREGRRTRRRYEREKNDFTNSHLDGMSSDDELPDHELSQYKNNLDQIEVEADDLFEDACEEFYKIEHILSKFQVWRITDMESYKEAFASLCLPKIVGQIIRVKMMVWYPLDENFQDIEKMDWYTACMKYGWNEHETEESLSSDPDLRFVPTIIEKIILPKLTEIIENCWDPLSTTQNLRLVGLIARLGREYPSLRETSKYLQTLFNSILDKMKSSLENDVFIPIFPKQMQEAKTSFFQRQFCSGLKFFRNLLSWQGIISDRCLKDLAISSLLNRYLLSAMRVCTPIDAISKAYIIVNTLPTAWLQQDSDILESLQLFIAFLKLTINLLDRKNPLHSDSYDKAKQILQRLHSYQ